MSSWPESETLQLMDAVRMHRITSFEMMVGGMF